MSKLTREEQECNKSLLASFANDYKTIRLFNGNRLLQEYTMENRRYTDLEDARAALMVSGWIHLPVTHIGIDDKVFEVRNGDVVKVEK